MKRLFTLSTLIFLTISISFAQKVKYKKDLVSVDEKPYCTMVSKGFMTKDYTIKTLEGKTVATMKLQTVYTADQKKSENYYLISFIESGNQCESEVLGVFSPGSKLAEDLVEASVFIGGNFSEEGEQRFLKLHKRKFSEEIDKRMNAGTNSNNPIVKIENIFGGKKSDNADEASEKPKKVKAKLVERNKDASIDVWASKEIKQDFKKIGYYTETRDGLKIVVSIFLPEGKKVAKITFADSFAKQGNMTTFSDDEEREVKVEGSFVGDWVKSISAYLIDREYL
jgi:hypothetical protein